MTSPITITSLSVREKESRDAFEGEREDLVCPYLIVNLTFQVDKNDEDTFRSCIRCTEEYQKVINVGSPEEDNSRVDNYIVGEVIDWNKMPPLPMVWTYNDTYFEYIEKFHTFHFREWIADCNVTRTILADLEYFQQFGSFEDTYRTVDEHIFLTHLKTLFSYWD